MPENKQFNRIISHTDFDGIISAMLLRELFDIENIVFIEPSSIQTNRFPTTPQDIVCDLPKAGGMWFDHHKGQTIDAPRKCYYNPEAPSCARVIFDAFKDRLAGWEEIVKETDKIDSASYTKEEYLNPNACQRISISLSSADREADNQFRMYVINLLSFQPPEKVFKDPLVSSRFWKKIDAWKEGDAIAKKHAEIDNEIAVVDLVAFGEQAPPWRMHKIYLDNEGLKYLITARRLKITGDVKLSCGTNIFDDNDSYPTNIGTIMKELGGGGHKGIGGCIVKAQEYLEAIETIKKRLRA